MINDEHLQKQVESGNADETSDSLAYKKVFNVLKKDPQHLLPADFAEKVLMLVNEKRSSGSWGIELVLAVIGGLSCLITLVAAVIISEFKIQFGFLESVRDFRGVFIFGALLIILFHFLDKIVVRKDRTV
jgi:hypothetical protein